MKLNFNDKQISFLAECIREDYIENNMGLMESVDVAKHIEKSDNFVFEHFMNENVLIEQSGDQEAKKQIYKEVSNYVVRSGYTSYEKTVILTERKINDFIIRTLARIQSYIPFFPIQVRVPMKSVEPMRKGWPLKWRFSLRQVPEAYKDAMEQRLESRRDFKYLASEIFGAIEDLNWKKTGSNVKTYLHANKYRTIRMIDTVIIAARKKLTGFDGAGESQAALTRYMGGYSELAHAIYNIIIILVGFLFAAASLAVIKLIYVIIKKIMKNIIDLLSTPISALMGIISSGVSVLYSLMGKLKMALPRKKTILRQGKNIIKHVNSAKRLTSESMETIQYMSNRLRRKYSRK